MSVVSLAVAGKIQCRCDADPRVACSSAGRVKQINRVSSSVLAGKI